jgi:hypothetical protein
MENPLPFVRRRGKCRDRSDAALGGSFPGRLPSRGSSRSGGR